MVDVYFTRDLEIFETSAINWSNLGIEVHKKHTSKDLFVYLKSYYVLCVSIMRLVT